MKGQTPAPYHMGLGFVHGHQPETSAYELSYPALRADDKWGKEGQGNIKGKEFYPVGPDMICLVLFKPRNSEINNSWLRTFPFESKDLSAVKF